MRPVARLTIAASVLAAGLACASPITPQSTVGEALWEVWAQSSPTPFCWSEWSHEAADPPGFHVTGLLDGSGCDGSWLFHGSADSLVVAAQWVDPDPGGPDPLYFQFCRLTVDLDFSFQAAEAVDLVVDLAFYSSMPVSSYVVTLTHPDGSPETLIEADFTGAHAERTLPAGAYTLNYAIDISNHQRVPDYLLRLGATFSADEVATESRSWSAFRGLFR